jgi:acetyl esterase
MSDRVIDPEARAYLDYTASLGLPPLAEQGAVEARRLNSLRAPSLAGEPEDVALIEDGHLPGPGGQIPFRLYSPAPGSTLPVLLYMHGGGWVVGDLDTHDSVCRGLARRAECVVVALDYRLAPENPFPAAVEDGWAGLEWLHDHASDLGADPDRIAVCGDSSGGNLSAVVAQRSRDRGGPKLAAQVLIYPVTDCDFETPSYRDAATGYGLTRASMLWYWNQYLPDEARRVSPDASPLRAADLSELPPALVITCQLDPLASEGAAYAEALRSAGERVEHIQEPDMIHGYIRMNGVVSRARKSWDDCARFLRRELATHG